MHLHRIEPNYQHGVALITSLIFLVILTMLGLSVVNSTTAEEKMSRNTRDVDVAFAAAEAALRDAELHITGTYKWPYEPLSPLDFDDDCTNGLCNSTKTQTFSSVNDVDFYSATGIGANSQKIGTTTATTSISGLKSTDQPRYMIEMVCSKLGKGTGSCPNQVLRITAKSRGRLPNTLVVLQEVYLAPDFGKK